MTLARRLQEWSDLPMVMLTSVDEEETVVRAIESFRRGLHPQAVQATGDGGAGRAGVPPHRRFRLRLAAGGEGGRSPAVDFAHQRALVDGRDVALTSTETKLLYVLMRSAGRVVATDFLLRRLWPSDEVFEDYAARPRPPAALQDRARALPAALRGDRARHGLPVPLISS